MTLPNFLVIGATKGGTTSLDLYLAQHPDIFMSPVPEPNFFAFQDRRMDLRGPGGMSAPINRTSITDRGAYEALFEKARGERIIGETSPVYLYVEGTPERIHRLCPDAKLVAILRDPVERAFSAYQHLLREGREPLDFMAALDAEPDRIRDNWAYLWRYVESGRYTRRLRAYLEWFSWEQLRVFVYEDFAADPAAVCTTIFDYLGVDPSFTPETSTRYNVSGVPRGRLLHRILNPPPRVRRALWTATPPRLRTRARALHASAMTRTLAREEMPEDARTRLIEVFRKEVRELEALLGRPVPWVSSST